MRLSLFSRAKTASVLLFAVPILLLSPYIAFGQSYINIGYIAACYILVVAHPHLPELLRTSGVRLMSLMVCGCFTAIVLLSLVHRPDSIDFSLLQLCIRAFIYYILGVLIATSLHVWGLAPKEIFYKVVGSAVVAVSINALVVLLEYIFPAIKASVEAVLYHSDSMNINYQEHAYRLRGIASGGGANLSLFHALGSISILWLYIRGRLSATLALMLVAIVVASILVIGRTGLLMIIPATVVMIVLFVVLYQGIVSWRLAVVLVLLIASFFTLPMLAGLFLPDAVFEYAAGFLYKGISGVRDEGSFSILLSWYAPPATATEFLAGTGTFSGGFGERMFADPGYMKVATSIGVPCAILLYVAVFHIGIYHLKNLAGAGLGVMPLLITILLVLFVSELKEPFVFKGYSARMFWLFLGALSVSTSKPSAKKFKAVKKGYQ